eukprot:2130636-Pyramimonas_sp.AAC.1
MAALRQQVCALHTLAPLGARSASISRRCFTRTRLVGGARAVRLVRGGQIGAGQRIYAATVPVQDDDIKDKAAGLEGRGFVREKVRGHMRAPHQGDPF